MAASQNLESSKKGFAAFDAGDIDAVLADYDDSVEFVIPGNSNLAGTYRGKDGVKELFGKVAEQNFKITPKHFVADDEVVVVLSQVTVGRTVRTSSRCIHLPQRQSRSRPGLRGHRPI